MELIELLRDIFNLILYQPLFNALILLYKYIPGQDFGLAIIALTILIKILFSPLEILGIKSQKTFAELQPKIKEIQEKYKNDRQKQLEETMKLYQKEKFNPFSGCFPLLIQLPILLALYLVFWHGFQPKQMIFLYSFIQPPQSINPFFLNKLNLANPNLFLTFLVGLSQFFQIKMLQPKTQKSKSKEKLFQIEELIQKQTLYFFPALTILALSHLPSALSLYLLTGTLFSIIQQHFILKKHVQSG